MKKLLVAAAVLCCATAIAVHAQDAAPKKEKHTMTAEQKQVMADMLAKYDTNKDGKLDKTERAAITKEDKEKMEKAGLGTKKKHTPSADASADAPAANGSK